MKNINNGDEVMITENTKIKIGIDKAYYIIISILVASIWFTWLVFSISNDNIQSHKGIQQILTESINDRKELRKNSWTIQMQGDLYTSSFWYNHTNLDEMQRREIIKMIHGKYYQDK